MTTIVRHRRTGNQYILLGINGEENKTNPSRFINDLFNQEKSEVSFSATVCDVQGNLFLAYIDDLIVIEIDGKKPSEILPEPAYSSEAENYDQQQVSDFDEEKSEEEIEQNRVIITPQPEESFDSSNELDESDFDEDDEEWI